LKAQPGVVDRTVHLCREGANPKVLRIIFIRVCNLAYEPPFPDLDGQCAILGYSGPNAKFRDSDGSITCDGCD
jgi:hypothetical protein